MQDNATLIENAVLVSLPPDRLPREEELLEIANRMRAAFPLPDGEFEQLMKRLYARFTILMNMGTALVDEGHTPWLSARKPDIDPFYWNRFEISLRRRSWPPQVISTQDRVTDEILDLLGDPVQLPPWSRRGLVVGDVQSGKTATYTSLICKAADAGYRLVVLLTGMLENLRRQTQERLDEGFVGLDSSGLLQQQARATTRAVGVGAIDPRRAAGVFTSRSKDFNRTLLTTLGFRLDAFNEPVLVVVKKNKRILQNLEQWLRGYNAGPNGKIDVSLLMIDDEADNASINTNDQDSDPTSINEGIRSVLQLFTRSSYIGFTATPFANIFVDPETEHEMLGHDLFPRDFIYCLEPPSNYMGPLCIFDDEPDLDMLRIIEDAHLSFPRRHKSNHIVDDLPESLREAVRFFMISTTIRDLRKEGPTHRSMLVNVSQFTAVQDQVASIIDQELRQIQQDVRNYSQLPPSEALMNDSISGLKEVWAREFQNTGFDWPFVQNALLSGILPIVVKAVNQRTGAGSLDYKLHSENGLRVIAVGGNSLSRGLTLEGLSTSYFFRNSQMYDTLLQMGRWFGYRDGYQDLTRLWLTNEAAHWYAHITSATEELREELKRMRNLDQTPKEFGLKVRSHPDALIVTARNKMRLSQTIEKVISVSGQGLETAKLRSSRDVLRANALAVTNFLHMLSKNGIMPATSSRNNWMWSGVPRQEVSALLGSFDSHPHSFAFQSHSLAEFLDKTSEPKLSEWDVVIPNGQESDVIKIGDIEVHPQQRNIDLSHQTGAILVSGSKARVGSRGIEREGIPTEEVRRLEEEYRSANPGKSVPDKIFRERRLRPLLLIHVISPYHNKERYLTDGIPLIALGLSFPTFDDTSIAKRVVYRVNLVQWRSMFETETDDDLAGEEVLAD